MTRLPLHQRILTGVAIAAAAIATPVTPAQAQEPAVQHLPSQLGQLKVAEVVGNLDRPWAMAFLPDNEGILITEKPGKLRLWRVQGGLSAPINGVPAVYDRGQGGLLDVALAPDFPQSRRVYLTYAEEGDGRGSTAAGYGVLSADGTALNDFKVIFRQMPRLSSGVHFGSRLVFDRQGYLYIALGDNNQRPTAQDLDKLQGKIVRLHPDGGIPDTTPS